MPRFRRPNCQKQSQLHYDPLECRKLLAGLFGNSLEAEFGIETAQLKSFSKFGHSVQRSILRSSDLDSYSNVELQQADEWVVGVTPTGIDSAEENFVLGNDNQWKATAGFLVVESDHSDILSALTELKEQELLEYFFPVVDRDDNVLAGIPNDPDFDLQFHLRNVGQNNVFGVAGTAGIDINVVDTWDNNVGGSVRIGVLDTAVQWTHPELTLANNVLDSYDYFSDSGGAFLPDVNLGSSEAHGTSVAGLISAQQNNNQGVSGVAPASDFSSLRIFLDTDGDGRANWAGDTEVASALNHRWDRLHIYNNSWGTSSSYESRPMLIGAMESGIQNGRSGLGSIYVKAVGNGANDFPLIGRADDEATNNTRYAIGVGAITNRGVRADYSEVGSSLMVVAPADDTYSVDMLGTGGYTSGDYSSFNGTSAATPIVSGAIALILQENPNLTWRDVQHIVVNSATIVDAGDSDWVTNGAGHTVNHNYGYGMVNVGAAVTLASNWQNVGAETSQSYDGSSGTISDNSTLTRTINVTDNFSLETVEVDIDLDHTFRGDLEIRLISPSGTVSTLVEASNDNSDDINFTFATKRLWDESSVGTWTLEVVDTATGFTGVLNDWDLTIYGVDQATDVEDNYEENDTAGTAADPNGNNGNWENTLLSSIDGIGVANDDDWYQIDVTAGFQRIVIDATFIDANGDIDLGLYSSDGSQLLASGTSTSDNEEIDFVVPTSGLHLIRVWPYSGSGNTYDLVWDDVQASLSVDIASGSIGEGAGTGATTATVTRVGSLENDLVVNLSSNDTSEATVQTSVTIAAGQATSPVFNIDAVDDAIVDGTQVAIITASATGYSSGSDTVDVLDDDVAEDSYEENDTAATASDPENDNGQWERTLLSSINGIGIANDDDWYQINVSNGAQRVEIDATFAHAGGDIDLELYNFDGSQLLANSITGSDNERIDFVVPTGGIHLIRVFPYLGAANAGNTYDLEWDDSLVTLTTDIASSSIGEGDGTGATTATVTRDGSLDSALVVNLSSSDTSEATVPTTVTIAAGQATSPAFNINAIDDAIIDGTQTVTITATVTGYSIGSDTVNVLDNDVEPAEVSGSFFHYHGSDWGSEVASDKVPLQEGQVATFANYSSYSKGINGVTVEVDNLNQVPTLGTVAQFFDFHVGNTNSPSDWAEAPAPIDLIYEESVDSSGTDRITLIWNDNAIQNQWLEVKMLSTSFTGLAADEAFYFGNQIGEVGDDSNSTRVNLIDVGLARSNQTGLAPATIDNLYDINRDKRVNLIDVGLIRVNQTGFSPLIFLDLTNSVNGRSEGASADLAGSLEDKQNAVASLDFKTRLGFDASENLYSPSSKMANQWEAELISKSTDIGLALSGSQVVGESYISSVEEKAARTKLEFINRDESFTSLDENSFDLELLLVDGM